MFNSQKVFKDLQELVPHFSRTLHDERALAQKLWKDLIALSDLNQKIQELSLASVPLWQGELGHSIECKALQDPYTIVSVDGSQIYPDRHQGIDCYLLTMGIVTLSYGKERSKADLSCVPSVHVPQGGVSEFTPEHVNCHRTDYELKTGVATADSLQQSNLEMPLLLLFDGSLIFWHLESKELGLRNRYLASYLQTLEQSYQKKILTASYISLPKSRELVAVLNGVIKAGALPPQEASLEYTVDADLLHMLKPGHRTIIFHNRSTISNFYPEHLKPCYFYLNVGDEIARVEFPAWVAQDQQKIIQVAQIIMDQCIKGNGYPVALSEAHEQAVVKAPDRELFYHMLQSIMQSAKLSVVPSQKLLKKRIAAI